MSFASKCVFFIIIIIINNHPNDHLAQRQRPAVQFVFDKRTQCRSALHYDDDDEDYHKSDVVIINKVSFRTALIVITPSSSSLLLLLLLIIIIIIGAPALAADSLSCNQWIKAAAT